MSDTLRDATILNVGGDVIGRAALSRVLEKAGARVLAAATTETARDLLLRESVDAIVLNLPGKDSFQAAAQLRAGPAAATPVLHIPAASAAAWSAAQDLEEGGPTAYLLGPIMPESLVATLHALLRMRRWQEYAQRWMGSADTPQAFLERTSAEAAPIGCLGASSDLAFDVAGPIQVWETPQLFESQLEAGWRYLAFSLSPVRNTAGAVEGFATSTVGMTQHIELLTKLVAAAHVRAEAAEAVNADVNHRARNALMMAGSMLELQAAEQEDPRVASLLYEAVGRLVTFAAVQEQLQRKAGGRVGLLEAIHRIAEATRTFLATPQVEFSVEGEPVELPQRMATSIPLVVNELIANAAKHGAPDPDGVRRVRVRCETEQGHLRLAVWSSGKLTGQSPDRVPPANLGLRLVQGLVVEQCGGTFSLRPQGEGTLAEVKVDLGRG